MIFIFIYELLGSFLFSLNLIEKKYYTTISAAIVTYFQFLYAKKISTSFT